MRPLVIVLVSLLGVLDARAHPQDGPHAEIRLAIEDQMVTYTINLNLAFIDEIIPIRRESLGAVATVEAEALKSDIKAYLADNATVLIDGQPIRPVLQSIEMNTNPEPGMVALYPRVGARGLIRARTVMQFPCNEPPDTVVFGWTDYPNEILIEEAAPKPMFLEAQLRAEGAMGIVRFSQADPTVVWRRGESGVLFDVVPPIPESRSGPEIRAVPTILGAIGAVLMLAAIFSPRKAMTVGFSLPALGLLASAALTLQKGPSFALSGHQSAELTSEQAQPIFEALLSNLYKSFEFTSESDIYDALAFSVEGELLAELYDQVYRSLVQAENDGMVGVVTGIEPVDFELAQTSTDGAFEVVYRWRVDGTVYHWGHTHTRTHEYHARYAIAPTLEGWRIVEQEMIDQQRIDDGLGDAPPIGEL